MRAKSRPSSPFARLRGRALAPVVVGIELLGAVARLERQVQQLQFGAGRQPPARHLEPHAEVVVVATPAGEGFVVAADRLEGLARAAQRAVEGAQEQRLGHLAREQRGQRGRWPVDRVEAREAHAAQHHAALDRQRGLQRQRGSVAHVGRLGRMHEHEAAARMAHADVDGAARRAPAMRPVVDDHAPAHRIEAREQLQQALFFGRFVERDHHLDAGARPVRRVERGHALELGELAIERQHHAEHHAVRPSAIGAMASDKGDNGRTCFIPAS